MDSSPLLPLRRRIAPTLSLLLLSPLIAEVLSGSTRLRALFVFPIEVCVWGGGALLIRHAVRRFNLGMAAMLLLALALAMAEETVIQQSSLAPLVIMLKGEVYARAFGVNVLYLLWALVYESVYVVFVPICPCWSPCRGVRPCRADRLSLPNAEPTLQSGENMKRIIQLALLPGVLMLAACATPSASRAPEKTINVVMPSAAETTADDADVKQVLDGVKMIEAGHIQAAIDGPLNDVVRRYEAKYGDSKKKIYSARGMTDALLYSAASMTVKPPVGSVVIGPAWAMAYWARGYAYNEMARYDEAIVELRKALALAPDDAQYQVELAYAYQQKRDWQESLPLYQSALDYADITASDATEMKCKALRGQGYDLVELHRLDEAEAAYRACLKLKPNEPKSLGELEYIRRMRKKAG